MHGEWVDAVFAPDLDGLPRGERRARRAALATATDVYVWHLLRRREGLGRDGDPSRDAPLVEAAPPRRDARPRLHLARPRPPQPDGGTAAGAAPARRRGPRPHPLLAVEAVRAAGLEAEPIAPEIEATRPPRPQRPLPDRGRRRSFATFAARAPHEVADFEAALGGDRARRRPRRLHHLRRQGGRRTRAPALGRVAPVHARRGGARACRLRARPAADGGTAGPRPRPRPHRRQPALRQARAPARRQRRARAPPACRRSATIAESRHRAAAHPLLHRRAVRIPADAAARRADGRAGLWARRRAAGRAPRRGPSRWSSSPAPRSSRTTARSPPPPSPACATATAS